MPTEEEATIEGVLDGYAADAAQLAGAYEALSTEEVLAPVLDLLPEHRARTLEIGAGTGRDSAWLARRGHSATAAEPAPSLRSAGMALHPELRWLDDRLPGLPVLSRLGERFDLVLLVGVWQHLPPRLHAAGLGAVAPLLAAGGRLILSVRHGRGAPSRPCFPSSPDALVALAQAEGLRLLRSSETDSIQPANRAAGVTWTWLAFQAP